MKHRPQPLKLKDLLDDLQQDSYPFTRIDDVLKRKKVLFFPNYMGEFVQLPRPVRMRRPDLSDEEEMTRNWLNVYLTVDTYRYYGRTPDGHKYDLI